MPSLSFNAAVHRVMLLLGLTHVADVIAWADGEIESIDTPPTALLDVSMGHKLTAADMSARLSDLISDKNDLRPIQHVMQIVASQVRADRMDTRTAILDLYKYLRSEGMLYDEPFTIFHNLETDVALIRDGIFPESQMSDLRNDLLEAMDDIANQEISAG